MSTARQNSRRRERIDKIDLRASDGLILIAKSPGLSLMPKVNATTSTVSTCF